MQCVHNCKQTHERLRLVECASRDHLLVYAYALKLRYHNRSAGIARTVVLHKQRELVALTAINTDLHVHMHTPIAVAYSLLLHLHCSIRMQLYVTGAYLRSWMCVCVTVCMSTSMLA
jgi:hypothetical protein